MTRAEYIERVKSEFKWRKENDWDSMFLNHVFSQGVIDYERVECREFFTGKTWQEIDPKKLNSNNGFRHCLTDYGYRVFFPSFLLAALSDEEGIYEMVIFNEAKDTKPVLVNICQMMTPENRDLFFEILFMWAKEEDDFFHEGSIEKVKSFTETIR